MVKNLDQFIDELLSEFSPKQQKVIVGRFGLKTGKRLTLQEIGDELGITRERVRQIEELGIKKLREKVKERAADFIKEAEKCLGEAGGVRKDGLFMEDMYKKGGFMQTKNCDTKIRFVFLVAGSPLYHKEDDDFNPFWYDDKKNEKRFLDFVKNTAHLLETGEKEKISKDSLYTSQCTDLASCHLLSIPKHFGVNVFGEFGLRTSPEIEPKTIRDKAYLTLKRVKTPLHFEDIAKNISKLGIDKKSAHVQTVHNELIKDSRFVLVGRGVYALNEHGYEPGTVREVIVRLLKSKGPLHSGDVVQLVNQQRFLKENTILLNLQNRKYFKRLDDGRYQIKEA
jgi:hypothetical protein